MDSRKLLRRVNKSLAQLHRHDPEVQVSSSPTKHLFVANSSILCGVSLENLEEIFTAFDTECSLIVFQRHKSYSFVSFSDVTLAQNTYDNLNGQIPTCIAGKMVQPFYMAFIENVPQKSKTSLKLPKDLRILRNFISLDEEEKLLNSLEPYVQTKQSLKSRQVLHFGYQFDYDKNEATIKAKDAIPESCNVIIDRMMQQNIFSERPDQLTVNIYEPGNGIPSHVDSHSPFGDTIVSLSLLSDLVMEFRDFANTSAVVSALLPRFSLAVMQGESRYRWKHGIAKRKYDINPEDDRLIRRSLRISFTFRKVSQTKCQCEFVEYCDWDRNGLMKIPEEEDQGVQIEAKYVTNVYQSIASHFDITRHAKWAAINQFLDELLPGSLLLDVGCGNGKYLIKKDDLIKFGCDRCVELCEIVSSKGCNVLCCDALALPYRDSFADAVISIAVIHHFTTTNRRKHAIKELLRVLKSGGRGCITVWSFEQKKDDQMSEYLKMRLKKTRVPMNRRESGGRLRVHEGRDFTQQDMLVPWQDADGSRLLRYYHLFVAGELEEILQDVGGNVVEKSFYEQGNWIAVFRKA